MYNFINNNQAKISFKAIIISLILAILVIGIGIIFFNNQPASNMAKNGYYETGKTGLVKIPVEYNMPLIIKMWNNILTINPVNAQSAEVIKQGENIFKYINAYENTDVVQTRMTNKLKEDIILKKPGHPTKFEYQMDLTEYEHRIDKQGNLHIYPYARKDEIAKLFVIPAPFMIDADGVQSSTSDVEMYFENGILTLIPNMDWIASHKYPIILDPTIEINIVNSQSFPQEAGEWKVKFGTNGKGILRIIPNDKATKDALEFVSLKCFETEIQARVKSDKSIEVKDWECDKEASVINKVTKDGKHALRFEFMDPNEPDGLQTSYAYNSTRSDYEFLIKLQDETSLKKGDCVIFKQAGWDWGRMERQNFGIVLIKNLAYEQAEDYCSSQEQEVEAHTPKGILKEYNPKTYTFDLDSLPESDQQIIFAENKQKQAVEIGMDKIIKR